MSYDEAMDWLRDMVVAGLIVLATGLAVLALLAFLAVMTY